MAGGIVGAVGIIAQTTSAIIARARAASNENPTEKRNLYAASVLLGLSVLFAVGFFASIFYALSAKCGKKKKSKLLLIIFTILLFVTLISALIILLILRTRYAREGRNSEVTSLNAIFGLLGSAAILYAISLVLLYVTLGRKLKRLNRTCPQYTRK